MIFRRGFCARDSGFILTDACVGIALVCVLLIGLGELRSFQLKTLRRARTRACAAEIAQGFALLTTLEPGSIESPQARKSIFDRLEPTRALERPEPIFEVNKLSSKVLRLRCGVKYVCDGHSIVQEVDTIAPANR
jgi:hypothetical protein